MGCPERKTNACRRSYTCGPNLSSSTSVPVFTQGELEELAESAAVDLLPGRGHLSLRAINYYREKSVTEAGGVTFSVPGATAYYPVARRDRRPRR
jgi:hypothetical protein